MSAVDKPGNWVVALAAGALAITATMTPTDQALAGSGGAFVGGLIGGHVLTRAMDNDRRRTEAAEYQAYRSQQQPQVVYQQAPSSGSGGKSAEQRLDELDSLAAKGYISQDEYKARKKEILDSL